MSTFTLIDLPYAFDALEPYIDAKTMEIHYGKHHNGYVNKSNAAVEGTKWEGKTTKEILTDTSAMDIAGIRNNVGGNCNHSFFWTGMTPNGNDDAGDLADAIETTWGDMAQFSEHFQNAAANRFGSGWAWLVMNNGKLEIMSTANQDSPLSQGMTRVLGLDVWEHAYYLHYQNRRADYVKAWWNVVDWSVANERFQKGGI